MTATIAYLRNHKYNGLDDIDKIKDDFYKVHIVVSYDAKLVDGKRRVIFTATKGMRSQKFDRITYECNGLILEAPTWRPLTIPCPTPKTSVNNTTVSRLLNRGQYQIYKIMDGTVIYLYSWESDWYISTARGLDMAEVKLNGKKYRELFNDVLAPYETNYDDFTKQLDPNFSYSFVIRHKEIHPFTQPTDNGLIFVHKIGYVVGGNMQIDRKEHDLTLPIPCQEEVPGDNVKLSELYSSLSTSLDKWVSTKENPLFGYLLISTEPYRVGTDHSCVLLESNLMRSIRQFVYDRKYMEYGENRDLATVVHGFLSPHRKTFIALFPQYQPQFDKLDVLQQNLVALIMKRNLAQPTEEKTIDTPNVVADPVEYLLSAIQKKMTIDTNNPESQKHVLGIINHTCHTRLYMKLLNTY